MMDGLKPWANCMDVTTCHCGEKLAPNPNESYWQHADGTGLTLRCANGEFACPWEWRFCGWSLREKMDPSTLKCADCKDLAVYFDFYKKQHYCPNCVIRALNENAERIASIENFDRQLLKDLKVTW